jgi:hypothetical protein
MRIENFAPIVPKNENTRHVTFVDTFSPLFPLKMRILRQILPDKKTNNRGKKRRFEHGLQQDPPLLLLKAGETQTLPPCSLTPLCLLNAGETQTLPPCSYTAKRSPQAPARPHAAPHPRNAASCRPALVSFICLASALYLSLASTNSRKRRRTGKSATHRQ